MQSMTAFSRHQMQCGTMVLVWEIRSVNHRYLEVIWRLPEPFRQLEPVLKQQLSQTLSRGKIECTLKIQNTAENDQEMKLDTKRVAAIIQSAEILQQKYGIMNDICASTVLALPDIFIMESVEQQNIFPVVQSAFNEALEQLFVLRQQEGTAIRGMLTDRIRQLNHLLETVRKEISQINQQLRTKLINKLAEINAAVDGQRIEQEIALMLNRMDISEEIDRLAAHNEQVLTLLDQEGAIGRKLDFLMQELNREANTLGSKSDDIQLTRSAVEMKVLIEQMREQIQNIE